MKTKRILAMLLAGTLAAAAAGCGGSEPPAPKETGSDNGASAESSAPVQEDEGEPYTVAVQVVNIAQELPDEAMVEEAINEITLPAINCKVDIQNVFIGDLPTTTSMKVVGNEKIDIVALGLTQKTADVYNTGVLLPLDDYLQYAPDYVDLVKEYLPAGNIEGVQYSLPQSPYEAMGLGLVYNKDMADEYGIEIKDGCTLDELEEAFAILKEHGIYGTSMGQASNLVLQNWVTGEWLGTNGSCGMIADPVNDPKIENIFASDMFKDFCHRMKRWTDAGYMPADSLTDTTSVQEYFANQKVFCTGTAYSMKEFGSWGAGQDFEIGLVEVAPGTISNSGLVERMWGLAATCENPQKAMEFLNYMYVNPDVANLLMYGVEGQNYTIVEGTTCVTTPEGSVTGRDGYCSVFTQFGDPTKTYTAAPNTESYPDDVLAYNTGKERTMTIGYTFSTASVAAEISAVSNVFAEYAPRLQSGQCDDVDALLEEFNKKLDSVGYNDIIAENQKQLEAFLQSK